MSTTFPFSEASMRARLTDRAEQGYIEVVSGPGKSERAKRFSQALWVVFTLFAIAFVVDSTYEIVKGVFGWEAVGAHASAECAAGIQPLEAAIAEGKMRSLRQTDEHVALAEFRAAKESVWTSEKSVREACSKDDASRAAFAALLRIDLAEETAIRQRSRTVTPPFRDLRALVPGKTPPISPQ